MTVETDRRSLDQVLSKLEIHESIVRYCRGTDRSDRDAIAAEYHSDGVDDHGVVGELLGADWADVCMRRDPSRTYVHHLGQSLIELFGEDAFAETHWVAYQSWESEGKRYLRTRGGRYADWFQRRDGVWKVFVRRVVDDWSKVEIVHQIIEDRSVHVAAAYPHDPIYRVRRQVAEHAARS